MTRRGKTTGLGHSAARLLSGLAQRLRGPAEAAVRPGDESQAKDRLRLEEALRTSEEQWRAVFENNPTMYFMVDAAGAILSVNPFGAEQLGYTVDELVGQPVLNVFHDADRPAVQHNVARCFEHLGTRMSWELRKVRKDGTVLWVRETSRAMLMKNRPVVLVVCEDITERKRAEEELEQLRTALAHVTRVTTMGQLAASIAHEVNQPVAGVVTNADAALRWLAAGPPDLEEARLALGRIIADGNRASDVIGRIRAFIKKVPPGDELLDINEAIREALTLTQSEVLQGSVALHTRLADSLPAVRGDRVQLQQVVLNLVINAIESIGGTGEGPRELVVGTSEDDSSHVVVAVTDSGRGLDPAMQSRLFGAFQTTKPDGLGMGLSICRSIVEAHGGRIWAEANVPRGAVFKFALPAPRERAP
jgi:PAS domain S-box-containing protein